MSVVCHFASNHEGLDTRIALKECTSLAAAGYETHLVITATSVDVERAAAKGFTVHAMSQPAGRLARMFAHTWRCYRAAARVDAKVYHFHDPELIPYAMLLRLAGREVVYDVHEDYPSDILDKYWLPAWTRRLVAGAVRLLEGAGARWFFHVVAATPLIWRRFHRINAQAVNINNYPWPAELAPGAGTQNRGTQVCYVGNITRVRGLRPVIDALPQVPEATFVLCGGFSEPGLEAELRALPGWAQVRYLGKVDRKRAREVMNACVAGIVTFLPIRSHLDAQPNKLFEYMSAELPIIASDFPLWRDIVVRTGAGLCVDPESPAAIADAIRRLLHDPAMVAVMGRAGRQAVLNEYNWPSEAAKLVHFYEGFA